MKLHPSLLQPQSKQSTPSENHPSTTPSPSYHSKTSRTTTSSSGDTLLPWPCDFSPDLGCLWSLRSEPGSRKRWREKRGRKFPDGDLDTLDGPWSGGSPRREKMTKEDGESI
ncbi:hypothetical protein V6N11_042600 [Hibiscus sabdariffa]|uniref:Uncharacterized protein n=1 Tax=Hibiscus sabdariffa TaxID=183260 RepID=A0ABR2QX94_9ROSI